MKPLSEKLEEFVESESFYEVAYQYRHAQLHDQREVVKRFEELKAHIKGELQAWLREADDYLQGWGKRRFLGIGKPLKTPFGKGENSGVKMVLQMVLGTTQKPKQEGE